MLKIRLSDNEIIWDNQIVRTEFTPGVFDVERARPARLKITLTSIVASVEKSWEGEPLGVGSENERVILTGEDAERVWAFLCADAVTP